MTMANVDYWRTFRDFTTNAAIIADQPQDVVTFRGGDNIRLSFNEGDDIITFHADIPGIVADVTANLSVNNEAPAEPSMLDYEPTTGTFTYYPPDLSDYATLSYVDSAVASGVANVDLTGYATEIWVQGYVGTAVNVPDLDDYVTKEEYNEDYIAINGKLEQIANSAVGYTGSAGQDGSSVKIVGSVPEYATLTTLPRWTNYLGQKGDGVILEDTGNLAVATVISPFPTIWDDVGPIIGYTGSRGAQGFDGSRGDPGFTGSAIVVGHTVFEQNVASNFWAINHNLGVQYLSVELVDASSNSIVGTYGYPTVKFVDDDNLTISWTEPATGYAVLSAGGGVQGNVGFSGSQGFSGSRGFTGSIGFTGSSGAFAALGFTGSTGATGPRGFTGSLGNVGFDGSTGSQGIQGNIGFTGSAGIDGNIGFSGSIGFTGSAGTDGGLPANVNIATEDITLTVTSNADLANVANVISEYRLTSYMDPDGSRSHAPIIYVDISPGNYAVNDYFSIEHMLPNVRFRSNGGDATDTIIVFNDQVNIIDSTVRFDGVDVYFPYWFNVTDDAWVGLGMGTQMKFASDYFTIYRGARVESKNCEFGYTYCELSQNGMFWSGSGSNWAGTASDWYLLDTSQVHLEGSGGTNLFDFNDIFVAMQSKFYARHVGGTTVTCGEITLDDQSQAYIRSSSGIIDCTDIEMFDTSDLHLEALNTNPSGTVSLRYISRLSVTGNFNVGGTVNVLKTSTLTADNLTIAGSNDLNIYEGSTVVVEDRCTAPFIDMEGGTLTAVGSSASTDGDIYTQSLTADFGSMVSAKNDIAPSSGSTYTEINLMDSKLVANRILNCGQCNLISSDLRSEDGIQFDESQGYFQAFASYIGLNGPITQAGFTAANNGLYMEGSTLMSDSGVTFSYLDLNASKLITSDSLTVNGVSGTTSELDLFLGSELHCSSIRKTNTFDTNNFLRSRIQNGSTLHVSGQLGATTGDGPTLTANIELDQGSKCFIEDNSTSNNIGNCNIVVQNFSEFFSPLGRVSDY